MSGTYLTSPPASFLDVCPSTHAALVFLPFPCCRVVTLPHFMARVVCGTLSCKIVCWRFFGRKLHDDVPPMAASRVSKVLSRELDEPVEELFSSFNLTHPVGSASISQVLVYTCVFVLFLFCFFLGIRCATVMMCEVYELLQL